MDVRFHVTVVSELNGETYADLGIAIDAPTTLQAAEYLQELLQEGGWRVNQQGPRGEADEPAEGLISPTGKVA
jgi:hypothetical protein